MVFEKKNNTAELRGVVTVAVDVGDRHALRDGRTRFFPS